MRYYPFGSGSIPSVVVSSSIASYAIQAQLATTVRSASIALSGSTGPTGPTGPCTYQSGSSGSQGPQGPQGPSGIVFGPV